ncbi:MAG: alpha/beta fold hydrolase, partial [Marinobacter salsuginis]
MPDALLLASRGDRIVHWRCSAALEERWQWTMKLHPDAGHDLPLDDPEWIIQQLRNWLPR